MDEQMVSGDYTALVDLNLRFQMDTKSTTNLAGVFKRGAPFRVYEVYPERDGIVWGRVSSNTGSGKSIFAGLRVFNQEKAHLEKAYEEEEDTSLDKLVKAIERNTDAQLLVAAMLRKIAEQ